MSKIFGNAFFELMKIRAGRELGSDEVILTGKDLMFKTPFLVGETVAEALAARAVAANDLWELRTGRRQKISVDVSAAAATCLGGTDMTQKCNEKGQYEPVPTAPEFAHMVSVTQPWKAADDRWFLPHFNLPHLQERVLGVLKCENTPEGVAKAVSQWKAEDLDAAIAGVNATGGMVFTPEEWLKHPQGAYLASVPVVEITKIADSSPEPLPNGSEASEPLSGIRVLDLTRILAGPTAGIGMAEHGADVLMVTSPSLPQVPAFIRDTSHGKRSCFLDYKDADQAERLKELAKEADVFIEGYRPHCMEVHGFGPEDLAALRPGIVYISVNCFGSGGPYASRAGWDQVAQAVTGMCHTQGIAEDAGIPKLSPIFLCDFLTGFLGTFGAMVALARRAREGGSYRVQVSLCQSAMLIQRQGLIDQFEEAPGKLSPDEFEKYAVCDNNTVYGNLKTLGPVIRMSETSPKWSNTTPELGSSKPEWLPRTN
ncbi:CoA transferase [Clostridium estertheticum]|uniref:CoA transferase n=1 Tax=Clostridium estertheticum TaxID=238834 RepID=UPI001C7DB59E|nr:CoA transferase [Clostridium estertheticum]MBX4270056.1 CoA transferase [Clostridium estertheticum]WLC80260.1 CoA transferase [Clostridium estertheticum]